MAQAGGHVIYQGSDVLLLRAAARSLDSACVPWPDPADGEGLRTWLVKAWDDPVLREAVACASPSLALRADRIAAGLGVPARQVRSAAVALARYQLRAAGRPTPFGLFAGVAGARFGGPAIGAVSCPTVSSPSVLRTRSTFVRAGVCSFSVCLSPPTEGIFNLAEPGRCGGGPLRPFFAGTQCVVDLAELGGGHCACPLDQVVPAQGGQPGARGEARPREREPQHAFKGQSFRDADCHLDSPVGDVGIRWSDDLHRLEPGWLVFRQQHDRPSLAELDPPDLASSHVYSWVWDVRRMLCRPRLDVMQPCLSPGAFVLGLLAELPRKNCRTIAEQGRLCLPVVDLDHVCSGRCGWTRGRNIRSTISTRVSSGSGAFLVAAAATVPFAFAGPHTSLWPLGAVLLIRGFAIGTVLVPPLSIAYQDIPPDGIPHATMNTRITQQVGISFGIAIVAVVLQSQLAHSATSAFQGAFWWATGITTAALIPALTLPTRAREGD